MVTNNEMPTHCPAGIWTNVPCLYAEMPWVNVYSSYRDVSVSWRRWSSGPPFASDGTAHLNMGDNVWPVPVSLVNDWWFNPDVDADLQVIGLSVWPGQ